MVALSALWWPHLTWGRPAASSTEFASGSIQRSQPATAPGPAAHDAPTYWLRVTAERVDLRCRPDANSLAVTRVERDSVLRAVSSQFGWHRVLPPEGTFCFVSAPYVEPGEGDQGLVAVRSGRLRVRAGSTLIETDPARSEVQALLAAGTPVRIIERQGDWLKIAPPPGVYLYVHEVSTEPVSDEVAARLALARASTADTEGGPVARSDRPPRPVERPDLSGPWGQRLAQLESQIQAEGRRPFLEPTWHDTIESLRAIAGQREEPAVSRLAAAWMGVLEQRVADQRAVSAARQIAARDAREQARFVREMEQIRRAREAADLAGYAARGALSVSPGGAAVGRPLRYELRDPLTGRVEAYLEFPPELRDRAEQCAGKYVGVRGERTLEAARGEDVIRVSDISILAQPTSRRGDEPP